VFVEPTLANARRARSALVEFGFGSVAPDAADLAEPNRVWMLGRKPRPIDILTGISGVSFKEAEAETVSVSIGRTRVRVIGRTALIKNKLASARPKDLADVAMLRAGAALKTRGGKSARKRTS
jgi:hypothetical protein